METNHKSSLILIKEISILIETNKNQVVKVANSTLILLFWNIGNRINSEILDNKRAKYGSQIVCTISNELELKYGRNFQEKNLRRMMQFALEFPDYEIVVPLARQLSWSHFLILIPLKTMDSKLFYANKAIEETLGKRELRKLISSKTFERTEIVNTQVKQTQPDLINTFKDPYMLDFLNLKDTYLENDLEVAI